MIAIHNSIVKWGDKFLPGILDQVKRLRPFFVRQVFRIQVRYGAHLECFPLPLSERDPARASALLSPKVNPTVNRPIHVRRPHHRDVSLRIKIFPW